MVLLLGLSLWMLTFPSSLTAAPEIPEKLVYHIFWSGIRAGMATLTSERTEDGTTITTNVTSASFISLFYKVDDIAQSILYEDRYPKKYFVKVQEGRHRREKLSYFGARSGNDPQSIVYSNILTDETAELHVKEPPFDPLSGFNEIRYRPLAVGRSEHLTVFDNKKLWNVEVQVLTKERVNIPLGQFDTIVIKPILRSEGLFYQKGDFYIWLTDDEKRIPVLVKSKVKIGSFTAQLAEGAY